MEVFGFIVGLACGALIPLLVRWYPPATDPQRAPPPPLWACMAAAAVLDAALAWRLGRAARAVPVIVTVPGLLALAWIDARTYRLPRRLVFHTLAIGAVCACVAALAEPPLAQRVVAAAIAAVATSAAIAALWWLSPRGLGFGDVRLQLLLGAICGWVSQLAALRCLMWAFLLGGVASLGLLATRKRQRSDVIAFGPFLISGALLAILWPR